MGRKWWKKKHRDKQQQAKKAQAVVAQPVTQKATTANPWANTTKMCHDGVVGVFKAGKVYFWGGKARDVHLWNDWDLVVCFSDRTSNWEDNDPKPFCTHNHAAKELLSPGLFLPSKSAPFIGLDWPDYGQPELSREWWETLLIDLQKIDKEEVNVAICCTGGHGRTGSALAILHGLCWPNAADDPVALVRRIYCDNCVESASQIKYIAEITEREIKSKPAWTPGTTAGASGYYSQYEIGDRKPQGSAAGTKLAELETAAALNLNKSYVDIVKKAVNSEDDEGYWDGADFIPFGSEMMKPGFIYRPITNAAGDIVGWTERKDVAI